MVAMPFTNAAMAAHPAFGESVVRLRSLGRHCPLRRRRASGLHAPGTGEAFIDDIPWHLVLKALPASRPSSTDRAGPGSLGAVASAPRW